jgi:hypothetical protein
MPVFPAAEAEKKKSAKYLSLISRFLFVPFAVETLGAWGEEAKSFAAQLGRRLNARTQEPRATAFLIQRISLAIQRGNAASILGSLPSRRGFGELLLI